MLEARALNQTVINTTSASDSDTDFFDSPLSTSPVERLSIISSLSSMKSCTIPYEQQDRKESPEIRLRHAILNNALRDIQMARGNNPDVIDTRVYYRRDALAWFRNNKTDYPYSFRRICEALDLDPDTIRNFVISYLEDNHPEIL